MWRWLKRLPGASIRYVAFVGMAGMLLAIASTKISPEKQLWLAFIGLAYPIWMALSFLGLIYSIIRQRWWLLACLIAVFLITLPQNLATIGIGSGGRPDVSQSDQFPVLRVTSYNVRLFDFYNWGGGKQTRDQIFEFLRQNQVDVICFQEFYHTDQRGLFDTRDTLVTFLENTHVHERYTHEMTGEQYFGVVSFSKYPIVHRGEIAFASDANNFCIYTDLVIGGDTIRVYNAHLASIRFQPEDYTAIDRGPDRQETKRLFSRLAVAYQNRAEQIDRIVAHLAQSPYPTVFCGDFNDTPVSYVYGQVSHYMKDTFRGNHTGFGGTHIGLFPFLRIDYIWCSDHFEVDYFKLHDRVELSDHHPLEAHLRLKR